MLRVRVSVQTREGAASGAHVGLFQQTRGPFCGRPCNQSPTIRVYIQASETPICQDLAGPWQEVGLPFEKCSSFSGHTSGTRGAHGRCAAGLRVDRVVSCKVGLESSASAKDKSCLGSL